jgi:hypothetical protein
MFNPFAATPENKAALLESQVPNKRIGTPDEIANAIVFIGSDKASYIIGASLAVDGGMIAGRVLMHRVLGDSAYAKPGSVTQSVDVLRTPRRR